MDDTSIELGSNLSKKEIKTRELDCYSMLEVMPEGGMFCSDSHVALFACLNYNLYGIHIFSCLYFTFTFKNTSVFSYI